MTSWRDKMAAGKPRSSSSPTTRAAERERAEAAGLARIESEARRQRAKTERLKKLRLDRETEDRRGG